MSALVVFSVLVGQAADEARDEARAATSGSAPAAAHDHASHRSAADDSNVSLPLQSFAGKTGANAEELAKAHAAYDATLPPAPAGDFVKMQMTLKDMVVEVAPGVKYNTWAFDGHGAPGPVIHVREGQTVEMTLKNGGAIPHSIDFHAARIAPNVAFKDVAPGDGVHVPLQGRRPGRLHVPLRHEAGAGAHRQRHVRRDRRLARPSRCPRQTRSTSSSRASGT